MRHLLILIMTIVLVLPTRAITIGMVSNKMNVEIHLKNGEVVYGETKMPKESQDKLKIKTADGNVAVQAKDIDYMSVWSVKYDTGKKYVMRWSEYYKKPGGKIHKPSWLILMQQGPNCDMWCLARKANFGLEGDVVMWHKYHETTIELYWKKSEAIPTMIWNLGHCQTYFSDDKVIVEKIKTQKDPPFYMVDQVQEYIPGR